MFYQIFKSLFIYKYACYYYQTFVGLDDILSHPQDVDVIIISSLHFGIDKNGKPNIYLNDNLPDDPIFDKLCNKLNSYIIKAMAIYFKMWWSWWCFHILFKDQDDTYYDPLLKLINQVVLISGLDLDIEETVSLLNIKLLISCLERHTDKSFTLTMAPLASSLSNDHPGLGSFSYKELFDSIEGKSISRFHVQAYDSFSFDTVKSIVDNGYPADKVVLGMTSGQFNADNFQTALDEIKKVVETYNNFGGVFDWEYLDAPPSKKRSIGWAKKMKSIGFSL